MSSPKLIQCACCKQTHRPEHLEATGKILGIQMGLIWFDCLGNPSLSEGESRPERLRTCKSTLTAEIAETSVSALVRYRALVKKQGEPRAILKKGVNG